MMGSRYSVKRLWSSGRIPRCHRGDPGLIPGKRINFFVYYIKNICATLKKISFYTLDYLHLNTLWCDFMTIY